MKIFLSGSKTVTSLPERLTALLDTFCEQNCEFLIGDCFGADRLMIIERMNYIINCLIWIHIQ